MIRAALLLAHLLAAGGEVPNWYAEQEYLAQPRPAEVVARDTAWTEAEVPRPLTRCTAKTLAGARCRRQTRNESGVCWQHTRARATRPR